MRPFAAPLVVLLAIADIAIARPVPAWPYSKLLNDSDVVIVVRPGNTRDAVGGDPVIKMTGPFSHDSLTPVVTELEILAVLKGDLSANPYLLPHYRLDWDKLHARGIQGIANGPNLVSFEPSEKELRGDSWVVRVEFDYILFLKRLDNGQLAFVTGQYDSVYSVRQMHLPLPDGG